MNKITSLLLIIITVLCTLLITTMQGKAQNKSYAGVVPFTTSTDRIGFLDQNTGKIYLYDNNVSKCLFIGQLQGLGQNIDVVSKN